MVPRTMGLGVVARESRADQPRESSVLLRKSKTDLAAHLRTLFPAGRPGLSVGERQRYGPICLRIPVTNRLKVLDPPESASQNRLAREGVGLLGASPPT